MKNDNSGNSRKGYLLHTLQQNTRESENMAVFRIAKIDARERERKRGQILKKKHKQTMTQGMQINEDFRLSNRLSIVSMNDDFHEPFA